VKRLPEASDTCGECLLVSGCSLQIKQWLGVCRIG
jgi:hypothetical protein